MNTLKNLAEGLTWEVNRSTPYTRSESGIYVAENDYTALKRSDNGETLFLTNKTYTHTSNEIFREYTEKLSEASGYKIAGFAEFDGGRKVLSYLEATDDLVHKYLGLKSENYLVFGNSHDGTTPLFVGSVNFLLRCSNQYGRIMRGLKVRHTKNHDFKVKQFIDLVEGFRFEKEEEARMFQKMSEIKIDEKLLDSLANRLLNIDDRALKEGEILHPVTGRNKANLMDSLFKETSDVGMNLWGAFNGITHYTTHIKKSTDAYGNILGGNMKFNELGLKTLSEFALEEGILI